MLRDVKGQFMMMANSEIIEFIAIMQRLIDVLFFLQFSSISVDAFSKQR